MSKWGRTAAGSVRWLCQPCGISTTRKRKDNRERTRLSLFVRWLTSKTSLDDFARKQSVTTRTLYRWFDYFWSTAPQPKPASNVRVLVLDATSIVPQQCMLFIAGDGEKRRPISWMPVSRECHESWLVFLRKLMWIDLEPEIVVCDGQRGLLKAIHEVWPEVKVQRCLVHVIRQASN